jgi:tetratricopeptide (TPR) repeat protein
MLQLAQLLNADEKREEALVWVDRFLSETQSDDSTALGVKNQILMGMDKPELAIAFLEKQAAAKPDDKKLQMNLARAYQDANQEEKSLALLERMHKAGLFTEATDYEVAWRRLANSNDRQKDALALIDEGLGKGLLQPSHDIYSYQAQTWYAEGDTEKAIAAWTKGAPLGKDGQSYLNLSQALLDKDRFADAKAAAKSALDKGVKKPGVAWQTISLAETGLGNKAAGVAAAREAAKYPETKKWGDATLRASGGK